MDLSFVALDVETANERRWSICQLGLVRFTYGRPEATLDALVDPETEFDPWNVSIHGISEDAVRGQPRLCDVAERLVEFVGDSIVVSHTSFDRAAMHQGHVRYEIAPPEWTWLDSSRVARRAWKEFAHKGYALANLARHCGVAFTSHHAAEDARAAGEILVRACMESGVGVSDWVTRSRHPLSGSGSGSHGVSRDGDPEGPLSGEVIVFTGELSTPRATLAAEAAGLGCDVRDSVTRKTTLLVVGRQDGAKLRGFTKSRKQRKAEELIAEGQEIQILGESDFLTLKAIG